VPFFDDPFFRRFFGEDFALGAPRERIENSLGSGVIVGAAGLIVTNNHVIADAREIVVALADRREFAARVAIADPRTDLAVLKIEARGAALPVIELMDSDALRVGDIVLAIGNPFGVGQTVTIGIVSGLGRTQIGGADFRSFIQTDASINPGNSGGALVAIDGRLAGVNTAIFSGSGGSIGIGFAIPANMVRVVLSGAASGHYIRPWLGAAGQAVTTEIAEAIGLDRPGGVILSAIHRGGPADDAGLAVGDVVTAVNGHAVADPEGLQFEIATRLVGERVTLTVVREGVALDRAIVLAAPPETPPRDLTLLHGRHPLTGARVGNLSPALADEIGIGPMTQGVAVVEIAPGSPAERLRLRRGDVLVALNGQAISAVGDLVAVLAEETDTWAITLRRGERTLELVIGG